MLTRKQRGSVAGWVGGEERQGLGRGVQLRFEVANHLVVVGLLPVQVVQLRPLGGEQVGLDW
jgi:hypothetical protein